MPDIERENQIIRVLACTRSSIIGQTEVLKWPDDLKGPDQPDGIISLENGIESIVEITEVYGDSRMRSNQAKAIRAKRILTAAGLWIEGHAITVHMSDSALTELTESHAKDLVDFAINAGCTGSRLESIDIGPHHFSVGKCPHDKTGVFYVIGSSYDLDTSLGNRIRTKSLKMSGYSSQHCTLCLDKRDIQTISPFQIAEEYARESTQDEDGLFDEIWVADDRRAAPIKLGNWRYSGSEPDFDRFKSALLCR